MGFTVFKNHSPINPRALFEEMTFYVVVVVVIVIVHLSLDQTKLFFRQIVVLYVQWYGRVQYKKDFRVKSMIVSNGDGTRCIRDLDKRNLESILPNFFTS